MAHLLQIGPLIARKAETSDDLHLCQSLRHQAFFGVQGVDRDPFDDSFEHLMIVNGAGALLATLRLRVLTGQEEIPATYTGQFYDITGIDGPLIELGRFCLSPSANPVDVLRLMWAAVSIDVDRIGAKWLFGCSSFDGADPALHTESLARLNRDHLVEDHIKISAKAADFVVFPSGAVGGNPQFPPLLRSYLAMGGKTGNSAVIDPHMGTIHVCTVLEVDKIPPARARAVRALARS